MELDRCICKIKYTKRVGRRGILEAAEVIGAKEWVNEKFDQGHTICFFTSLPERLRSSIEAWLKSHGFMYHSLVFGRPVARTYHYIDDKRVQATTFRGRYTPLVRKELRIDVFS